MSMSKRRRALVALFGVVLVVAGCSGVLGAAAFRRFGPDHAAG